MSRGKTGKGWRREIREEHVRKIHEQVQRRRKIKKPRKGLFLSFVWDQQIYDSPVDEKDQE